MNVHSLHFGLNYPNTMNELAGCVNDANDCAAALKPYVASQMIVLNNDADRDGAHKSLATFRNRFEDGDVGIVTQSSHGTREKHKGKWVEAIVWADLECSYDYEMNDEFAIFPRTCPILFLGDFCHSGGQTRNPTRRRGISIDRCKTHAIDAPKVPRKLTYLYWAGCGEKEYCYDATFDGRGNGAFTYFTLKAAKELPSGATFHDWFKRISGKRPKGYLPSDDYPQTPVEYGNAAIKKHVVPF